MEGETSIWSVHWAKRRKKEHRNLDMVEERHLKREREALIVAAQNQALQTNQIKAKINKTQRYGKCRMCKETTEKVSHIPVVCACPKLAQKDYKSRNYTVAKALHWDLKLDLNEVEHSMNMFPSQCWKTRDTN